jgi:hypothetical protein
MLSLTVVTRVPRDLCGAGAFWTTDDRAAGADRTAVRRGIASGAAARRVHYAIVTKISDRFPRRRALCR